MCDELFRKALEGATVQECEPMAKLLEVDLPPTSTGMLRASDASRLWKELSYYGSNDLAYMLRGFEGVSYSEILRDVCNKQKVSEVEKGDDEKSVLFNEEALLKKLFTEMWDHMSEDERRDLLKSMNMDEGQVRLGGAFATTTLVAASLGGFGTYRLAVVVANTVARALVGRGLTFAGNAALTRAISTALGPVGWIVGGAWLAYDVAGPAFRKTVPAIIQVAALRQLTKQREIVGVMGHGSVGKDSLLKHVFGIDTKKVHPIPGTTTRAELYDALTNVPLRLMNFPGFGDLRAEVEQEIQETARTCSAIIYLFNGSEIPKRDEIQEFKNHALVSGRNGPLWVLVILNKWDKADDDERDAIVVETSRRLQVEQKKIVLASMKPGKENKYHQPSVLEVKKRLNDWASSRGREKLFPAVSA